MKLSPAKYGSFPGYSVSGVEIPGIDLGKSWGFVTRSMGSDGTYAYVRVGGDLIRIDLEKPRGYGETFASVRIFQEAMAETDPIDTVQLIADRIASRIVREHGSDDGISQEFHVEVETVTTSH